MKIERRVILSRGLMVGSVLYVGLLAGIVVGQTIKSSTEDTSATNTDTSNLKISVQKTIALTNSSPTGIDFFFLGNSGSNESDQKDLTVTVTTNNPTGYTLLMNTISSTTTDNTDLEHELDSSYNIPATTNPVSSPATLELNSWGYSTWGDAQVDAPTTFYTLPTQTTHHTLRTTADILDTPNTKLTFATYIPNNKPAGEYQKRLLFTATTNYVPQDVAVEITAPTDGQVLPAGTTQTTLQATTSLDATCKYGTANTTYDLMPNTFTTTGTQSHSTTITGLQNETTYTYYVSCQTPNDETTVTTGRTFGVDAPTGLVEGANMQDLTKGACDSAAIGTIVNLKDTRDGTYYRVKKMPDGNCWMVDNLAYDINTAPAQGKPAYNPTPQLASGTMTSVDTQAQYIQNNNIEGQGQIPNNGNPKASYLYNWCAALGDTSADCTASANAANLQTVLNGTATTTATATDQPEVQGICPIPFRLPKGGPASSPVSTPSSTASEFVKLDISMGGLGTNRNPDNIYLYLTGTTIDQKDWFGTLGGGYGLGLGGQGSYGLWWSSTAFSATSTYNLYLQQGNQMVYPAYYGNRNYGLAVRCLL